jgi:hypothetical protein
MKHKEDSTATRRELDVFRSQSFSARSHARKDASLLSAVSSEDIARAAQAEKELLEMLDAEEESRGGGGKTHGCLLLAMLVLDILHIIL